MKRRLSAKRADAAWLFADDAADFLKLHAGLPLGDDALIISRVGEVIIRHMTLSQALDVFRGTLDATTAQVPMMKFSVKIDAEMNQVLVQF